MVLRFEQIKRVFTFAILLLIVSGFDLVTIEDRTSDRTSLQRYTFKVNKELPISTVQRCMRRSVEAELRTLVQVCKARRAWFSTCTSERRIIHTLTFDPVTRRYKLSKDRIGDQDSPVITYLSDSDSAAIEMAQVEPFSAAYLGREAADYLSSSRGYLSARSIFRCSGQHSETIRHLSYILTLGMIDLDYIDSGWRSFEISESTNR